MPLILPETASDASQRRAQLAGQMLQLCPDALADEIALVGSTAHGFADDESDLEINLWANALPPLDLRLEWLVKVGADDLRIEAVPRPDDSYWIGCRVQNIPVEIGWQTYGAMRESIVRLLSASDRKGLAFGDLITSAIPLRTGGQLAGWQVALAAYSDEVQRNLIEAAVESWSKPDQLAAMRRLARHGERIALEAALLRDLNSALRVLYAAHRRWEPSRKWMLSVAQEFAPPDLIERIDAVLCDPSLEQRVDLCAQFCLDMLALVPEGYDISAAVKALQTGL